MMLFTSMRSIEKGDFAKRYKIVFEIGSGATSTVQKAFDLEENRVVALKICNHYRETPEILREVDFLTSVSSKSIVSLYDSFVMNGSLYLCLEFCPQGNISKLKSKISELYLLCILRDVNSALKEIHSKNKIHFDVKPQNILLNGIGEAKLADFGVSRNLDSESVNKTGAKPGTAFYMAPEMVAWKPCTPAVDIFALGMSAFEMAVGVPLALTRASSFEDWISKNKAVFSSTGEKWDPNFTEFIRSALNADPTKRPTSKDLSDSALFSSLPQTWEVAAAFIEMNSQVFWDE